MTLYQYRAVSGSGEIVEGELEAATRDAVIEHLHRQGHTPIRADAVSGASLTRALNQPLFTAKRVSRRDMVLLTGEIATLLQAGLPLERALEVLVDLAEAPAQRSLLNQILDRIRGGGSLADALAEHERVFPRYYVSMVRAGEAGGSVEVVMSRLADFMERSQKLRENVRSALIYPIIVVVMAGLSVMVLLTVVLPQFTPMFEDAGQALPLITQIVIAAGEVVQSYWWAMAGGLAALILGIRLRLRNKESRYRWDAMMLRLPLFGGLIAKIEAARFSRTLATLVSNGVAMLTALSIVKDTLGNAVLVQAMEDIGRSLKEGEGLAGPLSKVRHFPRLGAHLIAVGEETGRLEEMLFKAADIYDDEVQRTISRLLALLVPALTLGLGLLIAVIIGAIFAAILSVYDLPF